MIKSLYGWVVLFGMGCCFSVFARQNEPVCINLKNNSDQITYKLVTQFTNNLCTWKRDNDSLRTLESGTDGVLQHNSNNNSDNKCTLLYKTADGSNEVVCMLHFDYNAASKSITLNSNSCDHITVGSSYSCE